MKDKNKNKKGFSLIEMLVVVFIIVSISMILVVNWRKNEKGYRLIDYGDSIGHGYSVSDLICNCHEKLTPVLCSARHLAKNSPES